MQSNMLSEVEYKKNLGIVQMLLTAYKRFNNNFRVIVACGLCNIAISKYGATVC